MNRAILGRSFTSAVFNYSIVDRENSAQLPRISSESLIISAHQPTLLPYPELFYRMYHSNIMDLCPYDPLSRHNDRYQHRVKIGTDDNWKWFTLPIEASDGCSMMNVKLKSDLMNDRLLELEGIYRSYPFWSEYKDNLKEIF